MSAFQSVPGATAAGLRRAIVARAHARALGEVTLPELPEDIGAWVDKVARYPSEVTDDDVAALLVGHSEDEIVEITEAAALGASLAPLDAALAAIRDGRSQPDAAAPERSGR
ncbi:MAG: hypothetical protein JOZ75_04190 [Candidatus Dormibacteraeota bacterium]|nr:hypothetical protein [Candidatus Dormibacteraeota bacterium]